MELRTATGGDAAAIAGIVVAVARHAYADLEPQRVELLDPDEEAGEWRARLTDATTLARVAQHGGRVVGATCWRVPRSGPGSGAGDAVLTHLVVHPAAQNAGVGGALLADAEDALRAAGGRTARLSLHEGAWWAARFVERRGWAAEPSTPAEERPYRGWSRSL